MNSRCLAHLGVNPIWNSSQFQFELSGANEQNWKLILFVMGSLLEALISLFLQSGQQQQSLNKTNYKLGALFRFSFKHERKTTTFIITTQSAATKILRNLSNWMTTYMWRTRKAKSPCTWPTSFYLASILAAVAIEPQALNLHLIVP